MRNLINRIPKPYLGFIALFFLVGATACEQLIQDGAREAAATGREIRALEDAELMPLKERMQSLQFDEIEPRQREIEDLHREIERIQRTVIDPLWNNIDDPWGPGGELTLAQEALQEQYALIDAEFRQIEIESRALEREFRDNEEDLSGFDPIVRAKEDERYDLQRELDRLYRFGQEPIEEIWNQVNSINSNPGGTFDSNQFEIDQVNNKIAGLHDEISWLQSDLDQRIREKEDFRGDVQEQLDNLHNYGRHEIDRLYSDITRLENELVEKTVVNVSEVEGASDEIDALRAERDALIESLNNELAWIDSDIAIIQGERSDVLASYQAAIDAKYQEISLLSGSFNPDGTPSSTDPATDNAAQIAALQSELAQVIADRDDLVASYQAAIDVKNQEISLLSASSGSDSTASSTAVTTNNDAEIAAIQAEIAQAEQDRDAAVADYQVTIDAKNQEINLLSTPITPTTTTGNAAQIAAIQAEILQAEADRDAAVGPLNDKLSALHSDRDALSAERQPVIDDLNLRIFNLQDSEVETVTTVIVPQWITEELDGANEASNLESMLSSVDAELNDLYATGSLPIEQIYRDIDQLNNRIEELRYLSDQDQLAKNDAVNSLAVQAEYLQQQLNAEINLIEQQLFDIDDELQLLYRDSEDNRYDGQIAFNEAQRALEDRRYALDDQRWLLDQQQQDLHSQNVDPWKEVQVKADLIWATEIQPLQDRINELENELQDLWNEQRQLEREMRLAEQGIRDRERELEDKVFDLLDAAAGDGPPTGETGIDGTFDGSIEPIDGPQIDPIDALDDGTQIDQVIEPIIDDLSGATGDIDPVTITDDPVVDPEPVIEPIIEPIEPDIPADVEEVFEQS
jgi:hypothetical protein